MTGLAVLGQSTPPTPPARTIPNRYRLDELIAEGGFALVYTAYDTELQRTVAIKIPKPSKLGSKEDFLAEARRVARLKHDSIVPVHDVGVENETCSIVTEYVKLSDPERKVTIRLSDSRATYREDYDGK